MDVRSVMLTALLVVTACVAHGRVIAFGLPVRLQAQSAFG